MTTIYNAIKTDLAIQYTQDQLVSGDIITIKSFGVASDSGNLDATRTLDTINTTWFSTQFTSTNITTSTVATGVTQLGLEMIVPASIELSPDNHYMTEFYIIGNYQNEDFLFGIMQTQLINKLLYVDNTAYTYDVNFDLSNYTNALNVSVDMVYQLQGGNYVLQDGSVPFIDEQEGVDATSDMGLVTLRQIDPDVVNYGTTSTTSTTSTTTITMVTNTFGYTIIGAPTVIKLPDNLTNSKLKMCVLELKNLSTLYTITQPTGILWRGGDEPDLTDINSSYTITYWTKDNGVTWRGSWTPEG